MKNTNYFLAMLMAIIGLTMLLAAQSIVQVLVVVLGICALFEGVIVLGTVMPLCQIRAFKIECLVRGIASLVVGLLCVILPLKMAEAFLNFSIYLFAIYALASAFLQIAIAWQLHMEGFAIRRYVVEIVFTILLAVILFILPVEKIGFMLIRICGTVVILASVIVAIVAYKNRDIILDDATVSDAE